MGTLVVFKALVNGQMVTVTVPTPSSSMGMMVLSVSPFSRRKFDLSLGSGSSRTSSMLISVRSLM